jgi:hypothetical protein
LRKQAKECGFFKREGAIEASAFFDMLLYCANRNENSNLSFMSLYQERCHGTVVSRTAINNRFNDACELFVAAVLSEILRERYKVDACLRGKSICRVQPCPYQRLDQIPASGLAERRFFPVWEAVPEKRE